MTWEELAKKIASISLQQRQRPAQFVQAYDEPTRRVFTVEVVNAHEDVYYGISIGSERVLVEGEAYLREAKRA
jgi:hypothetical protein